MKKILSLTLGLVLGSLFFMVPAADACVICGIIIDEDGWIIGDIWIFRYNILPIDENRAWITIPDYETVASHGEGALARDSLMEACSSAHSKVPGIASVDHVGVYRSDTGELLYDFEPEPALDKEFAQLSKQEGKPATDWWSFYTDDVPEDIPSGLAAHFNLLVTLEEGFTFEDLAESLRENGVFATSAATLERTLHEDHFTVFEPHVATVVFSQGN